MTRCSALRYRFLRWSHCVHTLAVVRCLYDITACQPRHRRTTLGEKTKIEWTDSSWNVITGCSLESPGCTNCYAMKLAGSRLRNHPSRIGLTTQTKAGPVWNGALRFNEQWLEQPLRWATPRRIFVCAHGDLFHENAERWWIVEIFAVMIAAHHLRGHTFQVLTKRAKRMHELLNDSQFWEQVYASSECLRIFHKNRRGDEVSPPNLKFSPQNPPPGIWVGISAEDQKRYDERVGYLRSTPAVIRWVSAEPLLSAIDMRFNDVNQTGRWDAMGNELPLRRIDWVVAGGESGRGARPFHPDWARSIRDQCAEHKVAFFWKQWGDFADATNEAPGGPLLKASREDRIFNAVGKFFAAGDKHFGMVDEGWKESGGAWMVRVGKKMSGRLLDGREHNEYPTEAA